MRSVRTLGLFGVAGFNRGDDAISRSLIAGFRRERADITFVVPTLRKQDAADPRVRTFLLERKTLPGMARLVAAIARCDAIVVGGGSLVQDQLGGTRTKGVLGYAWTVTAIARALRKPLATAPLGVDDLTSDAGRVAARETLNRIGRITVRDVLSERNARILFGRADRPVHVACDPVFDFPVALDGAPREDTYVLSPAFEGRNEDRIVALFRAIATTLLERHPGCRVAVIAMDDRAEEDAGKAGLIVDALPEALRARVRIAVPATPEEAAAMLRTSRGVVAMRLHAMIMAYGHVPIYALSHTTKTDAMIETNHIPGMSTRGDGPVETIAMAAADGLAQPGPFTLQQSRATVLRTDLGAYYGETLAFLDRAIARS
ncbi:polysaccharide pyruvyl transferase family protein [Mongoliimonas terrestris]|uniref:polysaccharide pyruvyl transferase family protein n=1 Tax=Mongoliimonas terrestris TaxID=1709001 RepID=UPI0009499812|nr:polysaccharide pyruvyl transferase family protein [Mongoliimonas terrestris]